MNDAAIIEWEGRLAPSSHTTVHTVRYTAVQSHKCSSPLLARVLRLCYAPVFPIAVCVCAFAFWTFCDIIMTFGAVGQVSAPGQIPVEQLNYVLGVIHNSAGGETA